MDTKRLKIFKIDSEVRFASVYTFSGQGKVSFMGRFVPQFPDWGDSYTELTLKNEEKKLSFKASCRNAVMGSADVGNYTDHSNLAAQMLEGFMSAIGANEITRLGTRFQALYAVDERFNDLRDRMGRTLFVFHPKAHEFYDMALIHVLKKGDSYCRLRLAPISKGEGEITLKEDNKDLPDVGIFVDLDVYQKNAKQKDLLKFLSDAYDTFKIVVPEYVDKIFSEGASDGA